MSASPVFSIIVPTHKRPMLLGRALQSIKQQSFLSGSEAGQVEVLVVSDVIDASTDAVCSQLLGSHDRYLRRSGVAGPALSRNLALDMAQGSYVLFLDDDDALQPHWLEELAASTAFAHQIPIYADCTVIAERRLAGGPEMLSATPMSCAGLLNDWLHVKNQVHMSCYALPRYYIGSQRFDPYMRAYEDWEFLLGLYRKRPAEHVGIQASFVFEVYDETSDRRGGSTEATGTDAVLDYLYVYRRYPGPDEAIRARRAALLALHGLQVAQEFL